jgi:hypothetical protein
MIAAAESSERGDARFDYPVYVFYRSHIGILVREAAPDCDAAYVTEALLGPLAATQFVYLRRARGMPVERVTAGYEWLVRRLLGPGRPQSVPASGRPTRSSSASGTASAQRGRSA